MAKRNSILLGSVAFSVLASTVVGVSLAAQGGAGGQRVGGAGAGAQGGAGAMDTHGVGVTEKTLLDGKPAQIKVVTRNFDNSKLTAPTGLSEEAYTGRVIWLQKCAFCHDGVGQPTYKTMGPWLGAEVVKSFGEDSVRAFINNGDPRMPAFKYALDSKQVDDVIAFLKTIPSDQKPTANQLGGKREGPGNND